MQRKEKIAYGAGDIGYNFLFDLGQIYLLKFYTDTLGLPASIAGMVFLVTKIWDAFSDFTIGTVVHHRKKFQPKGKFLLFILYTAVPLALMTVTNFLSPDFSLNGKVIWYLLHTWFSAPSTVFPAYHTVQWHGDDEKCQ